MKKITKLAIATLIIISFFGNVEKVLATSAPSATNLNASETYTEDSPLNLTDIVVSDTDSSVTTVTLTLSSTGAGSLSTGTSGAVTSTYNAGSGVWTASGAIADVNVLLAGVIFTPTGNYNSNFTISTSVTDETSNNITGSKTMTGTAVNDAPVLDISKSPSLSSITEDTSAPTGAVGTLVSSLVDFSTPAGQVDNVSDVDSGASLGIALTASDTSLSCYYSLNGGATWIAFGSISSTSALLLAADSDNRLYCRGSLNLNGSFPTALTFKAWDRTSGTDGSLSDASTNGGTTAFSTATDTIGLTIISINDAPTATNMSTSEIYTENTALNLTDIVVSDIDSATITATLTLSDNTVGTLSTGTSGAVTSTYNAGSGVWTASGAIADVNVLLAGVIFTPTASSYVNFTITTDMSDGALSISGSKAFTGTPALTGCSSVTSIVNGVTYTTTCGVTTVTGLPFVPYPVVSSSINLNPAASTSLIASTSSIVPVSVIASSTAVIDTPYQFPRNLKKGMIGDDVVKLQQFLNSHGFSIALSGPGSSGKETNSFGTKTEIAVKKFQIAYANEILSSQSLAKPTGWFYTYTRVFANKLIAAQK